MGFLKFLKRNKAEEMDFGLEDDLDIPPPPPDLSKEELGKAGKEFPEFPEIPEAEENIKPPDEFPIREPSKYIPKYMPKEKPLPPLDFPEQKFSGRGFPEERPFQKLKIPREEEFPKPMPMPKPSFQAPRPLFPRERLFPRPMEETEMVPKAQIEDTTTYMEIEKEASKEEVGILRHKKSKGPIYVRIEKFRDILANTNTIKNNLRIASQSIERLAEIDENRERVFVKWHGVMLDMQKKFIFVDKSVFKKSR